MPNDARGEVDGGSNFVFPKQTLEYAYYVMLSKVPGPPLLPSSGRPLPPIVVLYTTG